MAIVMVSRGWFTGGQALAECLARKLGYAIVSREDLIADASASFGVPVEKFVEAMDKAPSFWERLTGERTDYLRYMQAALVEHARQDNLVFHGYTGHLLLPNISHVVRVRAIADMETRIQIAMERHGIDRKDALARIKKVDKDRADWTRFLYGVDWQDPSLYDVVLNLGRMGVDDACEALARLTEMESFKPTPASRCAMADLVLSNRVWVTLAKDPVTMAADLKVVASDGNVIVSGSAVSWDVVDAIPSVASQVEGVKSVKSEVGVTAVYETPV